MPWHTTLSIRIEKKLEQLLEGTTKQSSVLKSGYFRKAKRCQQSIKSFQQLHKQLLL